MDQRTLHGLLSSHQPDDAEETGVLLDRSRTLAPLARRRQCRASLISAAAGLAAISLGFLAWGPTRSRAAEKERSMLFEAGAEGDSSSNASTESNASSYLAAVATQIAERALEGLYEVSLEDYVDIVSEKNASLNASASSVKPKCAVFLGKKEGDWIHLMSEGGYVRVSGDDGVTQVRQVSASFEISPDGNCSGSGQFAIEERSLCEALPAVLGNPNITNTTFVEEPSNSSGCFVASLSGASDASAKKQICSSEEPCQHMTTTFTTTTITTTPCPACTPPKPIKPEIVIPVYERDLCKFKYTAKSISTFDPDHLLSDVRILWVSNKPVSQFQADMDEATAAIKKTRNVWFHDFTQQMNSVKIGGWFAQMILKLKVASVVGSDFYVVLDSKNTFIRKLEEDTFFSACHQGIVPGFYQYKDIPVPHNQWYDFAAKALGVSPPQDKYYPASITPILIHKQTIFDMFKQIGEDPDMFAGFCKGKLCDILGVFSTTGKDGATEFTMYTMYAFAKAKTECIHDIRSRKLSEQWAVSLWRGEPSNKDQVMKENLQSLSLLEKVTGNASMDNPNGDVTPLIFGAQPSALDAMNPDMKTEAVEKLVKIFTNMGLYEDGDNKDEFMNCVIGVYG